MEITANICERVEKGIELDTTGQDSIDLIAIRIDTQDDLPDDTELTVVFRGRELLCIPIQRMTRDYLSLWSIRFDEFAKDGLPGDCIYHIHVQSKSQLPAMKLHYNSKRLCPDPKPSQYELLHYNRVESLTTLDLPPSIFCGIYIPDEINEDLEVALKINGIDLCRWHYNQMLLASMVHNSHVILNTPVLKLERVIGQFVLEANQPVTLYVLNQEFFSLNQEKPIFII